MVETASGSRYFLSPDEVEKEKNTIAAFKDLAAAQRGGTITITKETKEKQAKVAMKKLEKATPRPILAHGPVRTKRQKSQVSG